MTRNWEVFIRPRKIARQNDALIMDLRRQGATHADIAVALGYKNSECARMAYERAKRRVLKSSGAS